MVRSMLLLPGLAMATHMPEWFQEKLKNADRTDAHESCNAATCEHVSRKYSKMLPMQAGVQWDQHGGYCGAMSTQRAVMAKGAYISQQQVRDHAKFGGGHDEEILTENIIGAFEKLHIKSENWEFNEHPTPQAAGYLKFMKKQLVAGNPVIWMIMFDRDHSPDDGYTMDNKTNGIYAHIEPVVGILSNKPLTDAHVYDDDVFAYFDNAGKQTHYQEAKMVPGTCKFGSSSRHCQAICPSPWDQCLWDQRGYIYAVQDLADERDAAPLSLSISPFVSEPYTRGGAKPIDITGTLTVSELKKGSMYDIYRWDSAEDAFVYKDANKIETFTATSDTYAFEDPKKFLSSSATYYRCVPANSDGVIV